MWVHKYVAGLTGSEICAYLNSPLVIDLDGDGLETISLENGVYFDHENTGFRIKSGWVEPNEGILVRDLNGTAGSITAANCSETTPCLGMEAMPRMALKH